MFEFLEAIAGVIKSDSIIYIFNTLALLAGISIIFGIGFFFYWIIGKVNMMLEQSEKREDKFWALFHGTLDNIENNNAKSHSSTHEEHKEIKSKLDLVLSK